VPPPDRPSAGRGTVVTSDAHGGLDRAPRRWLTLAGGAPSSQRQRRERKEDPNRKQPPPPVSTEAPQAPKPPGRRTLSHPARDTSASYVEVPERITGPRGPAPRPRS
jgi:hypothetical protein